MQDTKSDVIRTGLVDNHNALNLVTNANPNDAWLKLACIYTFMDEEYLDGYNAILQQRKFDIIRNSAPDNEVFFCEWVKNLIHEFTNNYTSISQDALTVKANLHELQTMMRGRNEIPMTEH